MREYYFTRTRPENENKFRSVGSYQCFRQPTNQFRYPRRIRRLKYTHNSNTQSPYRIEHIKNMTSVRVGSSQKRPERPNIYIYIYVYSLNVNTSVTKFKRLRKTTVKKEKLNGRYCFCFHLSRIRVFFGSSTIRA